ncbi:MULTISPECIES: nucleotide exchange factor GrpE [unclassified Lysobacter]|jgi:molecular chaperone GrpE|uniref:nucleotide exchange factor GrpE n=1 Tax=unclassified Lysobacter TaxID=2635362 RepID=UPI001BE5E714|nr:MULTISPECIES: nucleotide exchange factor GrpE [unclassified Lysobacter]MBT2745313.1 nucleotide exchange factor GrpE [Lysobacter sp. ISL-42]MBT2751910.1 nucleotide exchange factor GrpE [Lysobacter sp. ISL-50]MBT2777875.1 nucleotide exchange factor GrpE [Lysobacter sp. ISL-54]MBT2783131.1 nucleotide exchange factor GrpE [Lysobacter sp. ISL-52]
MSQNDPNPDLNLDAQDPAPVAELSEVETLRAELNKLREDSLRERAELDNQRKRVARDVEMARKFANERLLGALLPVIDSLEAGLAVAGNEAGALREGMELTLRQLLKVADDNGLVAVDPTGQPFNPEHHQAMSMVPAPGVAPNHVVQVYQKGWLLNDRLLRPALVVVAQDG